MTIWTPQPVRSRRAPGQSMFEWFNSCSKEAGEIARDRVDVLYYALPEWMRPEALRRLKSKEDHNFYSMCCEMWYHRCLSQSPLRCEWPRQSIAGSLPDLVLHAGNFRYIVECQAILERPEPARLNVECNKLLDNAWHTLRNKRVRLIIREFRHRSGTPSAKRFAAYLDAAVSDPVNISDQHTITSDYAEDHRVLTYKDETSGTLVRFQMILRSDDGGVNGRLLWMQTYPVQECDGDGILQGFLQSKAKQHRKRSDPVLLCCSWHDFLNAPDPAEVDGVVRAVAASLENKNVVGAAVLNGSFLFGEEPSTPCLWHWDGQHSRALAAHWPYVQRSVNSA